MINYSLLHHDSGSILYSCLLVWSFFLFLSTNNFKKSSKARFGHMQVLHFYFSSNLVWKRRYFPRDLTENARATYIYKLQNCEYFESKKENWRHFSLEFLLNLCGFFIPQSNFGSSTPFTIAWAHTTYIFSTVG